MEVLIKLNAQTAGRDKIARLFQYLSRFLWHRLNISQRDGNKFKNLEYQLSTFRKLLRFGRCVDAVYSILPLFEHRDSTVRITVILSKICNALFLFADHLLWIGRADLCNIDTDKWGRLCNKYWLYSITMNLVRDFYEITSILKANRSKIVPSKGLNSIADIMRASSVALACVQSNRAVTVDTIRNVCDFFIPLNALGHVKLAAGTIGWLGVASSIAGLIMLVEPAAKLSPS